MTLHPVLANTEDVKVVNGRFKISMTPQQSAPKYTIRVKSESIQSEIPIVGPGWDYRNYRNTIKIDRTPRPFRAGSAIITGPDEFETGKEMEFQIDVPFAGRMLVAIETSTVLESEWINVKAGSFKWKYKPKTAVPNFYVSALVVKDPHAES